MVKSATSKIKSPFYILPEFMSPKKCEDMLAKWVEKVPSKKYVDKTASITTRKDDEFEQEIFARFKREIPGIEEYFNCKHIGTEKMDFQTLPENPKEPAIPAGCMNSKYLRKKWVKIADVDLTAILWMKDYNDSVPIDTRMETYGGKLEFPLYNFSFVPQRGTMVIYPAGPHFISTTSPILVGDLYQVRFNLAIRQSDDGMWMYQPANFPYDKSRGMIDSWFNNHI